MKNISILLMLLFFINNITLAQTEVPIPYSTQAVPKLRPAGYEFPSTPDSARDIVTYVKKVSQSKSGIHLPYPIIFMHGLGMKAEDWNTITDSMDTYYGSTFGGRFDFCLNDDGNNETANLEFWPTANADIALFSGTWVPGDYYYVNFDVGDDGSYNPINWGHDVKSRMSAAAKQGRAMREAVCRVMQLTGRKKVILVAHSMGGLCCRQYIQESSNWQSDGKHHVAKLVTAGSPHAGSNASLSEYLDWVIGVDDACEGKRDVKRSYVVSHTPGVFLYGGLEINSNMDDALLSDYYNLDVDCNGQEGDSVTGLNQKAMPKDLDFACIIGDCMNGCLEEIPGDGLVLSTSANLNTLYPNLTKNIFYLYRSNPIQIHGDLSHILSLLMEGMDEPNDFSLSYKVGFDTTYMSFTTPQPVGGYYLDYDDFVFTIAAKSNVKVSISNIFINDLKARFVNISGAFLGTSNSSNGASSLNYSMALDPGTYYLEIYGLPKYKSYLHPYDFKLTKTIINTGFESSDQQDDISIFPNPASHTLHVEGFTNMTTIKIFDMVGNVMIETSARNSLQIDISTLPKGIYTLVAENSKNKLVRKIVITD